jgi:Zinc knuckle
MEIDGRISRVKDLIAKREEIDAELASLFGLTVGSRKPQKCTNCGEPGHTARTCGKVSNGASNTGAVGTSDDTR